MSIYVGEKKSFKESWVNVYDTWQGKQYCVIKGMKVFDGKKKALVRYIRHKGEGEKKVSFDETFLVTAFKDKENQLWFLRESIKFHIDRCERKFSVFGEDLDDDEVIRRYNESLVSNEVFSGINLPVEGEVSGPNLSI